MKPPLAGLIKERRLLSRPWVEALTLILNNDNRIKKLANWKLQGRMRDAYFGQAGF